MNHPKINFEKVFKYMCKNGHLEVAKWLLQIKPNISMSRNYKYAFADACKYGHLELAKWLLEVKPTYAPVIYNEYGYSNANHLAFYNVCETGHLEVAQWLLTIKPSINISARNEHSFRRACENGYLHLAKWLLQIKPTIDIFAVNDYSFRYACENGHLEVAKWLQILFPYRYKLISNTLEPIQIIYTILQNIKINGTKYEHLLEKCPICWENNCDIISICNHSYCKKCISHWLSTDTCCPICRKDIKNDDFYDVKIRV
jgi:ankyrin repeat protein